MNDKPKHVKANWDAVAHRAFLDVCIEEVNKNNRLETATCASRISLPFASPCTYPPTHSTHKMLNLLWLFYQL